MTPTAPKRRWFAFSLRTLFVVMTVVGCYLGITEIRFGSKPRISRGDGVRLAN